MRVRRVEIIQRDSIETMDHYINKVNKRIYEINSNRLDDDYEVIDARFVLTENLTYRECQLIIGYK